MYNTQGTAVENQTQDPLKELAAMKAIAEALKGLERDGVGRVLRWAADAPISCLRRLPTLSMTIGLAPAATDASSNIDVTFNKAGKTVKWDPSIGSLLDFAEENLPAEVAVHDKVSS